MAEQEAVNFKVAGSSPARGASHFLIGPFLFCQETFTALIRGIETEKSFREFKFTDP